MLHLNFVSWGVLALLWTLVLSDDALKNHRAEKRQDDSFLFFGGWRPVRQLKSSGTRYLQTSASNRYHDILSALPHSFDATASYYTHALPPPTRYNKDIYNYYPRPAIKSKPKQNTPVYMERLKPQPQQQKHGGGVSNPAPQFIDIQSIDLKQIQDLHDLILQTKHLPLSNLNLPFESGKPLEILEVSLQSLQNQNYGGSSSSSRNNNRHQRNRNSQRGGKGHKRGQQSSRQQKQQPVQFEYVAFPKTNLPQILPKEIELGPIKLPHVGPSIQDVVDLKNVQIIEVPISSVPQYGMRGGGGGGGALHYAPSSSGTRSTNSQQYGSSNSHKSQQQQKGFQYYAQQQPLEQPRKQYSSMPQQLNGNHIQIQPNIEAELIKLDDETLKDLLANLQILEKSPHDLLKYFPIGGGKNDNVQLILSLPEQGGSSQNYDSNKEGGYGNEQQQYGGGQPQYESKPSGSYQKESGYQSVEHNDYDSTHQGGGQYENSNYQTVEVQSGYEHQKSYQKENQGKNQNRYQEKQQYSQQTDSSREEQQQQGGSYGGQSEPTYIEVISPQSDDNGYRREPVLALEIQHGQTIEEALKSLDPETLQKIGAHSKDGIEIEVVEVPVDDYVSESKKTETVVSPKNSTVAVKTKKRVKILTS